MRTILPLTDIFERENDYVLISDVPGAKKEGLTIDVDKTY